jgi:hypothetical protein
MQVNQEKRTKKFNKEMFLYKTHPNYDDIKELYINNVIKTIISAQKAINKIRITKKGKVFKTSIKAQEKIVKEKQDFEKSVKDKYFLKMEKDLLLLDKNKKEFITFTFADFKYINLDIKDFVKKFIGLTNKINANKKLMVNIDGQYYVLNDETKKRFYDYVKNYEVIDVQVNGSDEEYFSMLMKRKNMTVSIIKSKSKYNKSSGEFFKYLNKTDIDLSVYQIYNKEQFNKVNHNECCLHYALQKIGLSDEKLNSLKVLIKNRNIPMSDIEKICDLIKISITIKKLSGDRNKTFIYGKKYTEKYNLGLIEDHYFAINKTMYTKYSINNYWKVKDIKNFGTIINDKLEREKKFIDSFDLITLFINKKEDYLENMTLDNCNIANTQFYDKIDNNITNLEYDEEEFTQPVVKEEKIKKEKYKQTIFFDVETYRNENDEHIPYLLCALINNNVKTYYGPECGKLFLKDIKENSLLIAHNVSYDYRFIIDYLFNVNEISRGSKLIGCNACIYNDNKTIEIQIKDSYHLIGQALRNFSKIFNLEVKKEVMPYDLYNELNINNKWVKLDECLKFVKDNEKNDFINNVKQWDLLNIENEVDIITYSKKYCELDVIVLSQGYKIFSTWMNEHFKIDCDECLTIASLAHKYLLNTGCYNDVYELGGVPQKFIQGCVVGGRTMTNNNEMQTFNLENDSKKKAQDFDATSLYPSAMKRMKGFLKGKPKVLKTLTYDFLKQQDGYFIEIKIKSVGINRNFSLMSYKTEEGIRMFSNDMINKIIKVDKCTLEDLIEFQQIEFDVIRGYYFNEGYNNKINEVIQYIFSKRLELKKVKNPAELTYKLIMNNAYGKSIMKPIENEIKLFTKKDEFEVYIDRNYNWISSFNTFGIKDNKYRVKVIKRLNDHFNICQVGVEILSMSKRIMNEVMNLAEDNNLKIYYQDTDSMHIEEQDIEILQRKFNEKYNRELIGKGMGQFHSDFDLKGCDDVYASRCIFLGKKSYIDELKGIDSEGKVKTGYHIRMKGIPNSCIEYTTKILGLNNPFELYQKLMIGEQVSFDLTEGGKKANFDFTKDYKIKTKTQFNRNIKF